MSLTQNQRPNNKSSPTSKKSNILRYITNSGSEKPPSNKYKILKEDVLPIINNTYHNSLTHSASSSQTIIDDPFNHNYKDQYQ